MNPYEVLGVQRDASDAQLKKARQRAAKKHHPDREGGSVEAMADINKAYDTLIDPEARRHYDETGEVGNAPDLQKSAIDLIRQIVNKLLKEDNLSERDNLLAAVRAEFSQAKAEFAKQQALIPKVIEKTEKRLKKIESRQGGRVLQEILEDALSGMRAHQINLKKAQSVIDRATEILSEYVDTTIEVQERGEYMFNLGSIFGSKL